MSADPEKILTSYPYPIARPYSRWIEQTTLEGRLRWAELTLHSAFRYVAVVILAEYSQFQGSDGEVNNRLRDLEHATLGKHMGFIRDVPVLLLRAGHRWFCSELPKTLHRIRGLQGPLPGTSLLDFVVKFRGDTQHLHNEKSSDAILQFEQSVRRVLEELFFLTHYSLLLGWERDGVEVGFVELSGPEDIEKRSAAGSFRPDALTTAVLVRPGQSNFLRLSPFVRYSFCPVCREEGIEPPREMFLLDGSNRAQGVLRGERHGQVLNDENPIKELLHHKAAYAARFRSSELSYNDALALISAASLRFIQSRKNDRTFIEGAVVARPEIEGELDLFLDNEKTVFFLGGASGIGKSCLLCKWTQNALETSKPVLILDGSKTDFDLFEESLLALLNVDGCLTDLITVLADEGVTLTVAIDGINEHPRAAEALIKLQAWARRLSGRWKLIVGCRTSQLSEAFSSSLPEADVEIYHRSHIGGVVSNVNVLTAIDYDDPLLETAYEAYQSAKDLDGEQLSFCPTTSFSETSFKVRTLMSSPGSMRLLMETFHGRELPRSIGNVELIHAYLQRMAFDSEITGSFINRLALEFVRQWKTAMARSDLWNVPDLRAGMLAGDFEQSALDQLVERGILRIEQTQGSLGLFEIPKSLIRFGNDRIYEFLLANIQTLQADFGPERLRQLILASPGYPAFDGTVQIVWEMLAKQDNGELLCQTLGLFNDGLAGITCFAGALSSLSVSNPSAYRAGLSYVLNRHLFYDLLLCLNLELQLRSQASLDGRVELLSELLLWQGDHRIEVQVFALGCLLNVAISGKWPHSRVIDIFNRLQKIVSSVGGTSSYAFAATHHLSPHEIANMQAFGFSCLYPLEGIVLTQLHPERSQPFKAVAEFFNVSILPTASLLKLHSLRYLLSLRLVSEASPEVEQILAIVEQWDGETRPKELLRAFDRHDIDLNSMVFMQFAAAEEEITFELRNLAASMSYDLLEANSIEFVERVVAEYVRFKMDPFKVRSLDDALSNVAQARVLANAYKREKEYERAYELCLLVSRVVQCEVGFEQTLSIESLMRDLLHLQGEQESIQRGLKLMAMDRCCRLTSPELTLLLSLDVRNLVLSGEWRRRVSRLEEDSGISSGETWTTVAEKLFSDEQRSILRDLAFPWLTPEQQEFMESIEDPDSFVTEVLSTAPFLRRVSNKRFLIELLAVEIMKRIVGSMGSEGPVDDLTNSSYEDRVLDELLLLANGEMQLNSSVTPESVSSILRKDSEEAFEKLNSRWGDLSEQERLIRIVYVAITDELFFLTELHLCEDFCKAISKPCSSDETKQWIDSVLRCWIAEKRRGWPPEMDTLLEVWSQPSSALLIPPQALLPEIVTRVHWTSLEKLFRESCPSFNDAAQQDPSVLPALAGAMKEVTRQNSAQVKGLGDDLLEELTQFSKALENEFK